MAAEEGPWENLLRKQDHLLCRSFDTIKKAVNFINSEDDVAIAEAADLIVPNGFTSMPPFEFPGLDMFMDSD